MNTPLRRFAASFIEHDGQQVKIVEIPPKECASSNWAPEKVMIRDANKSRGKWVVSAVALLNTPGCWLDPSSNENFTRGIPTETQGSIATPTSCGQYTR